MNKLVLVLGVCSILMGQSTLQNEDVVKLVKAGIADDVVILAINKAECRFDLSVDAVIALNQNGVSDPVVRSMQIKQLAPKEAPTTAAGPQSSETSHAKKTTKIVCRPQALTGWLRHGTCQVK